MWKKYVPVSVRKARAEKRILKLKKQGVVIKPVNVKGRVIAKKFWGRKWCEHLETFSDFDNRLPRGRTYVRNGSVFHLDIQKGKIEAKVSGSLIYNVTIEIKLLDKNKWKKIKELCSGKIGSILELLQGKLSDHVMNIAADHETGLFPNEAEISFDCSCPDWTNVCKHVAAVLYGVGSRLDDEPELLFLLRGVDAGELIKTELILDTVTTKEQIDSEELAEIFDIDLEDESTIQTTENSYEKKITGQMLYDFRQKIGYSVEELGESLNLAPSSIKRWEKCPGPLKLQSRSRAVLASLLKSSID